MILTCLFKLASVIIITLLLVSLQAGQGATWQPLVLTLEYVAAVDQLRHFQWVHVRVAIHHSTGRDLCRAIIVHFVHLGQADHDSALIYFQRTVTVWIVTMVLWPAPSVLVDECPFLVAFDVLRAILRQPYALLEGTDRVSIGVPTGRDHGRSVKGAGILIIITTTRVEYIVSWFTILAVNHQVVLV